MHASRRVGLLIGAATIAAVLTGCSATAPSSGSSSATPPTLSTATPAAVKVTPTPKPTVKATSVAAVACAHTAAGTKHIYVSIRSQHLWACSGRTLFLDGAVTTGASALTNVNDATPIGTSRITNKMRNTVLSGSDVNGSWNDPVKYWMPFNGGDGFHNAPWQTFPLGSPLYKTKGSHGCVHMSLHDVAALYGWAPIGTLVTVNA
ncbi:MAG: L,D-transpeptidase family protein [Acidobacteria bacterium]|nr:L,D-transpeptidase family protein [Acidobacteriota bacterium]